MPTIRLASVDDAESIRRIYAPFCLEDSSVSFEVEPPTVEEMGRRIAKTLERHPWLVLDDGGEVLGYVYASVHRDRPAYRWSADVSAYVAEGRRGSGIGRALYTSLFAILKFQHYATVYAGVALPNPASVGLHTALGFEPVGIYRHVGFKCGAWHDVAWYQKSLGERPDRPESPITLAEAQALPGWDSAIGSGLSWLGSKSVRSACRDS